MTDLHNHDCQRSLCQCKCGCQVGPFCTTILGPLCSECHIRTLRDDDDGEHGLKEAEA